MGEWMGGADPEANHGKSSVFWLQHHSLWFVHAQRAPLFSSFLYHPWKLIVFDEAALSGRIKHKRRDLSPEEQWKVVTILYERDSEWWQSNVVFFAMRIDHNLKVLLSFCITLYTLHDHAVTLVFFLNNCHPWHSAAIQRLNDLTLDHHLYFHLIRREILSVGVRFDCLQSDRKRQEDGFCFLHSNFNVICFIIKIGISLLELAGPALLHQAPLARWFFQIASKVFLPSPYSRLLFMVGFRFCWTIFYFF